MGHEDFLLSLAALIAAPALIGLLLKLTTKVRKGSKGVILASVLLGVGMIPDPLFERIIRVVQTTRQHEEENQDEDGEPYS